MAFLEGSGKGQEAEGPRTRAPGLAHFQASQLPVRNLLISLITESSFSGRKQQGSSLGTGVGLLWGLGEAAPHPLLALGTFFTFRPVGETGGGAGTEPDSQESTAPDVRVPSTLQPETRLSDQLNREQSNPQPPAAHTHTE